MFKRGVLIAWLISSPVFAQVPVVVVHPLPVQATDQRVDEVQAQKSAGNSTITHIKQSPDRRAVTFKDVINYVPSVYIQPRNGAESSRVSIRGAGLANSFQGRGILIMQDGIPINMADGEFEFPVIDPWLISYVRTLPGANALAEGGSTLGGAIDFMTPETNDGTTLRFEGGSFGTAHGSAGYGKTINGVNVSASGNDLHQDGYRDHNRQDSVRLNAQASWQVTPQIAQRLFLSHTVSDAEIPGAISWREISNDPATANPNNVAGHFQRNLDITRIADRMAWQDGPNRLETSVYYMFRTLDNPVTTYIKEINHDSGVRVKYSRGSWTSGVNFAYGTQDETRYANVGGHEGAHILDRDLKATNTEAFAQIDHPLIGKLSGIASVQAAFDTRDITETFPARTQQNKTYAGFNPRLGLRYDINTQDQVFANISRSFEPPTWAELSDGNTPGFNDLNAQTATIFEAGMRGRHWSAALFRSYLHNEFVNYKFASGATDTVNIDRSIHDGLELGWQGDIAKNTELRSAYTLSRFRLSGDPLYGSNTLPGMPQHSLRAEITHRIDDFSFGPSMEYASATPVDLTNTQYAKSYVTFGGRATWRIGKIETYVEGRNLLDRKYAATTNVIPDAGGSDGRYYFPGEGRAVYAGLRAKF